MKFTFTKIIDAEPVNTLELNKEFKDAIQKIEFVNKKLKSTYKKWADKHYPISGPENDNFYTAVRAFKESIIKNIVDKNFYKKDGILSSNKIIKKEVVSKTDDGKEIKKLEDDPSSYIRKVNENGRRNKYHESMDIIKYTKAAYAFKALKDLLITYLEIVSGSTPDAIKKIAPTNEDFKNYLAALKNLSGDDKASNFNLTTYKDIKSDKENNLTVERYNLDPNSQEYRLVTGLVNVLKNTTFDEDIVDIDISITSVNDKRYLTVTNDSEVVYQNNLTTKEDNVGNQEAATIARYYNENFKGGLNENKYLAELEKRKEKFEKLLAEAKKKVLEYRGKHSDTFENIAFSLYDAGDTFWETIAEKFKNNPKYEELKQLATDFDLFFGFDDETDADYLNMIAGEVKNNIKASENEEYENLKTEVGREVLKVAAKQAKETINTLFITEYETELEIVKNEIDRIDSKIKQGIVDVNNATVEKEINKNLATIDSEIAIRKTAIEEMEKAIGDIENSKDQLTIDRAKENLGKLVLKKEDYLNKANKAKEEIKFSKNYDLKKEINNSIITLAAKELKEKLTEASKLVDQNVLLIDDYLIEDLKKDIIENTTFKIKRINEATLGKKEVEEIKDLIPKLKDATFELELNDNFIKLFKDLNNEDFIDIIEEKDKNEKSRLLKALFAKNQAKYNGLLGYSYKYTITYNEYIDGEPEFDSKIVALWLNKVILNQRVLKEVYSSQARIAKIQNEFENSEDKVTTEKEEYTGSLWRGTREEEVKIAINAINEIIENKIHTDSEIHGFNGLAASINEEYEKLKTQENEVNALNAKYLEIKKYSNTDDDKSMEDLLETTNNLKLAKIELNDIKEKILNLEKKTDKRVSQIRKNIINDIIEGNIDNLPIKEDKLDIYQEAAEELLKTIKSDIEEDIDGVLNNEIESFINSL